MVQRVQIVEEEERAQDPRALDDCDPRPRLGSRAMLGKRADQLDGVRGDHHRHEVEPQRHAADHLHPENHRHAPQQVLEPAGPQALLVADCGAPFGVEKPSDGPEWADYDPPGQRLLNLQQRTGNRAEPCPLLRCPIIGFRVVERVGESLVDVVQVMTVPIALVRQPQGQRHQGEQPVDVSPAGRVTVHDFVLQRAMQRDQQRGDRSDDQERPATIDKSNRRAIRHRRPQSGAVSVFPPRRSDPRALHSRRARPGRSSLRCPGSETSYYPASEISYCQL